MFVQEDFYQANPKVVAHFLTQLSLKSGLKQLGDKAYAAVTLETKQLHSETCSNQSIGMSY
jgi:hypothetical protein